MPGGNIFSDFPNSPRIGDFPPLGAFCQFFRHFLLNLYQYFKGKLGHVCSMRNKRYANNQEKNK